MSKLLDLPEGTYRCTKVEIKDNGAFRLLEAGYSVIGEYRPKIVVGERFHANGSYFSDYISTSVVKDFELLTLGKVKIETENSYYMLEEVTDSKNTLT